MNRVFGWPERLGWAVLIALLALPAHAQLMLAHEGHHAGDCVIKTGAFPVNFSAYEKPKGALPPMHAYCDQIPTTGSMIITVDLPDQESRRIPLSLRLVMEGHGPGGHELVSLPAQQYSSGSISFEVELEDIGAYTVLLETAETVTGNPAEAFVVKTLVRIPLTVGKGGGHGGHGSGFGVTEIALLLGVVGIGAFFWSRRRKDATT